ncbi:biotin carboxylase N-terminal domain-containing protein [Burkholderia thailandensis]|uniref:ATP-binding protein n=2 Tax=Burkholderia thailandensis TaxID=57975 RepID=UPI0004F75212|nr:biotin carboxylase N-terminal domain-containing protein [Burkholderia thailandensis]AIP65553.1 3-methylcrotonyl-CoA carboxylase [Burkholderia thailandensis]AOI53957.1 3-methylcrotonyl-CoA carboxylase [Burkholderia thailandensis]MCZ2902161.1 ATP-grasp domain-containing protein [Burkholderia thailandensis]MDD1482399.1 biotin/lipoyl-binding protein [Burkholderia thailandensis]MDD1484762.1 biotin/lipoyl-binding protein [Burkholderia thailandensis]
MSARRFTRLLIANRGEIAVRIARTARRLGVATIAVHSAADAHSPHVAACDAAVAIGGATPAESYLSIDKLIDAALASGAQAIHPGYGFLSENAAFARRVADAGLVFVGPRADAIDAMGDKARARRRMAAAGIPIVPGYDGDDQRAARILSEAERIGFPVMLKAAAGGGGRGMRRVASRDALPAALTLAASEAQKAFGDGRMIVERAVIEPRHVEVQVFADAHGHVVHLGERDCSVQRRHQKIVEEAPSPAVDAALRARLGATAVAVAREIGYVGAGTVEFLLDREGRFYFMEMNTRLQVEHPVTELITGQDLVEWQLRVAQGEALPLAQHDIRLDGHAIEVRLCAEDPADDFLPRTGEVLTWRPGRHARCDHALAAGLAITPFYDSMLGKLIAHGGSRAEALDRLACALDDTVLLGVPTNRAFLARLLRHPAFADGRAVSTAFIAAHFPDNDSRRRAPTDAAWAIAAWLSAAAVDRADALPPAWRGWRSGAPLPVPYRLSLANANAGASAEHADARRGVVAIDRLRAVVRPHGGAPISLDAAAGPAGPGEPSTVEIGGRTHAYCFAIAHGRLWLQVDGIDHAFAIHNREGRASAGAAGGDGVLRAPMNGRVIAVDIDEGATVSAGQTVMVIEAMKMEHAITAPFAGRIASLGARAGEQVAPGQVLAQLEPQAG